MSTRAVINLPRTTAWRVLVAAAVMAASTAWASAPAGAAPGLAARTASAGAAPGLAARTASHKTPTRPAAKKAATPGAAQPAPGPVITWGVAPSSPTGGPDGRAAFTYTNVVPGTTLDDWVGVTNYSKSPVTFGIAAADATNTPSGQFTLTGPDAKQTGIGKWVSLSRTTVTIPAGSEANVPFTLVVPKDATPGDHDGGVVASLDTTGTNTKGGRVNVDRRVGARIYLRVNGPLHPQLRVEHLTASYHGNVDPFSAGSVTVGYRVANTGNVALSARQAVKVSGLGFTLAATHPRRVPDLLPGQSIEIHAHLGGVGPTVRVDTHVKLVPTPAVATQLLPSPPPTAAASRGGWALPWPQLLLVLVAAALVWATRRWRHRRRHDIRAALAAAVEQGRREAAAAARPDRGAAQPAGGTQRAAGRIGRSDRAGGGDVLIGAPAARSAPDDTPGTGKTPPAAATGDGGPNGDSAARPARFVRFGPAQAGPHDPSGAAAAHPAGTGRTSSELDARRGNHNS